MKSAHPFVCACERHRIETENPVEWATARRGLFLRFTEVQRLADSRENADLGSPQDLDRILRDQWITADENGLLVIRLDNQHPIERILVMCRQFAEGKNMGQNDRKYFDVVHLLLIRDDVGQR